MRLPHVESAIVPPEKITEYLLCLEHREGSGKARWLMRYGFSLEAWEQLAYALREHARDNEVIREEDSSFGRRYIIEGPVQTPDGRNPMVRVIWFVEHDSTVPRLATAYPLEKQR